MLPQRTPFRHLLAPFSLSLLLSACAGLNLSQNNPLNQQINANSNYYLQQSKLATDNTTQNNFKLLAARAFIQENKFPQAQALLNDLTHLDELQQQDYNLIQAHLSSQQQDNARAEQFLNLLNFNELSNAQKIRFLQINAKIAQNQQHYLTAVANLLKAEPLLSDNNARQQNNDAIWALLQHLDATSLVDTALFSQNDPTLQNWLNLADLYQKNLSNAEALRPQLLEWQTAHPTFLLPSALQSVLNFQRLAFNKVAVILPLSGQFELIGNTVKAGIENARGMSNVPVTWFDSVKSPLSNIMQQVHGEGFDAVIGPLLKQNVNELAAHPSWSQGLSIIALNNLNQPMPNANTCYYSLAPEDEAREAAQKMFAEQIKLPLVLMPRNDLGQRVGEAFANEWRQLGGERVELRYYGSTDDLHNIFVQALGIIEVPKKTVANKLKTGNKNEPKGTQFLADLDPTFQPVTGVFALGDNQQMAQIKTALDNTDNKLPLFTTSRINSPNNSGAYNLMMKGVQFTELPMFQDRYSEQYQNIARQNKQDYSLMRLYAMGSDAWNLLQHYSEIRHIPGYKMHGLTGNIANGYGCTFQRSMPWFTFEHGQVQVAE